MLFLLKGFPHENRKSIKITVDTNEKKFDVITDYQIDFNLEKRWPQTNRQKRYVDHNSTELQLAVVACNVCAASLALLFIYSSVGAYTRGVVISDAAKKKIRANEYSHAHLRKLIICLT